MIINARDKTTKFLLRFAKTPLIFYPYYRRHVPLPAVIMIENTNCCNAHCVMCPRETLTRKRGFMDFKLFEKIIREVSSSKRKPVVHLHGFGEPLLDDLLPERIKLAKAFGINHTYLVTNASLLFPETAKKIIAAGLDLMKISFYGTDEESYRATMRRLDFKVALNNIKEFVKIRKGLNKKTPQLIVQYLPQETNGAKTKEFQSLWHSILDKRAGDRLNFSSLDNFGGGRAYNPVTKKIASVCFYPWSAMSVLCDGRAVTCCVDYNGVQCVGDVNSHSVAEIWNGPVLSAIRRNFGKLNYSGFPACLHCDWVRRR
ncbi:MAG: radical SAM protein [Proteobacteria bacterium]|nr:radical SAM protein [Pseudomonadota bacterium]MBU4384275.1 radical SAM protein [Pseudomonadota bacterium]MCG2764094.1 radical SAM protein [Desulfarculaceae bacterium]